ncbi:serine hydrolase domain-containing protein [Pseudonocardia sichuanensis]
MTPHPSRRALLGMLGAAATVATGSTFLTGCSTTSAARARRPGSIPDLEPGGSFERVVADLAADDVFAGNVLVAHRGEPVLEVSHGMADRERGVPHGPDTIYNIGSVTKLMTAVAITQLVAAGEVAFGKTLGTYLTGFPATAADTITVHDLLTHTAGLGNFRKDPAWLAGGRSWSSPEECFAGTIDVIRREQLLFAPGTRSQYSNSGYYVLGAIVAQVSGQTYWDYMQQHVFDPAGMTASSFPVHGETRTDPRYAHAYADPGPDGNRADLTLQETGFAMGGGAGGSYSTVMDLLRFARALQGDELLSPVYTQLLISGKRPSGLGNGMSTYGSMLAIINGHSRLGHSGGTDGVTANLSMYLDLDWVVAFTSNYTFGKQHSALLREPDRLVTSSA